ncbi:MAG: DUF4956 domain-containing protein [Thalassobius sp.]|nr:DUF4956 domain-containing protein [Thalassovita sp.]
MFDNLTEETYFEFPSFEVALFSIILSFILSGTIAYTYYLTNKGSVFSRNFFQAMVLSSIVSCMVIMAVGNNLSAGFGIIGAIAIIRFRMRVENPRNIIFIFAALSVGVASGVYGYSIAVAGTAVFCLVSWLLYISSYGASSLSGEFLLLFTLAEGTDPLLVSDMLQGSCQDFRMNKISSNKRGSRYEYSVTLKTTVGKDKFFDMFLHSEGISDIRLERRDILNRI